MRDTLSFGTKSGNNCKYYVISRKWDLKIHPEEANGTRTGADTHPRIFKIVTMQYINVLHFFTLLKSEKKLLLIVHQVQNCYKFSHNLK